MTLYFCESFVVVSCFFFDWHTVAAWPARALVLLMAVMRPSMVPCQIDNNKKTMLRRYEYTLIWVYAIRRENKPLKARATVVEGFL